MARIIDERTSRTKKPHIPLAERLKSIPGFFGLHFEEQPEFQILRKDGKFEIRRYEPELLAQTHVGDNFDEQRDDAFLRLANYIFGDNSTKEHISMTAPVLLQENALGWDMSFSMPKKFTKDSIPKPNDTSIHLVNLQARTVAAVEYNGDQTPENMAHAKGELEKWLDENMMIQKVSNFWEAFYDSPTTISFLKKNEIHIDITPLPGESLSGNPRNV